MHAATSVRDGLAAVQVGLAPLHAAWAGLAHAMMTISIESEVIRMIFLLAYIVTFAWTDDLI